MKHTQGPWQIENDAIIGNIDGGYGDDGSQVKFDVVCSMYDGYFETLDNWKANARLIAAAPELLEALEAAKVTLKAFLPDAFATIGIVESAIKKAKGE